jgi:hypothetical protein
VNTHSSFVFPLDPENDLSNNIEEGANNDTDVFMNTLNLENKDYSLIFLLIYELK